MTLGHKFACLSLGDGSGRIRDEPWLVGNERQYDIKKEARQYHCRKADDRRERDAEPRRHSACHRVHTHAERDQPRPLAAEGRKPLGKELAHE